jgi:shikimate 5-dehydrogenase
MPLLGFEPTIPVFERANTVHALDSAATVIGIINTIFFFFGATAPIWVGLPP